MKSLYLFLFALLFIASVHAQPCILDATVKGFPVDKLQLFLLHADYIPIKPTIDRPIDKSTALYDL